jgi:hypothetical protein
MIEGIVTNINTEEPLQLVNVYLSGTTIGSSTSDSGRYCLEKVSEGTYQLIIQHIGYEIFVKNIQIEPEKKYVIDAKLVPKVYTIDDIEIQTTIPVEWQDHLEFFEQQFLGESDNADDCIILNPEVLDFNLNDDTEEFSATTDSIIRVKNNSLGYQINLVLAEFKCKKDFLSYYRIYPRFELLEAIDTDELEEWEDNRHKTYTTSRKHFFSALAKNKLSEENFKLLRSRSLSWIMKGRGQYVDENTLRISDTRSPMYKQFYLNDFLRISYPPENINKPSIIYLKQDFIVIDTLGNVLTPQVLEVTGDWYDRRVADMLPMDYQPID